LQKISEHTLLDLYFRSDQKVEFGIQGDEGSEVHLSGYFEPDNMGLEDYEDDEDEEDSEGVSPDDFAALAKKAHVHDDEEDEEVDTEDDIEEQK